MLVWRHVVEANFFWKGRKGKMFFWHDQWSDVSNLADLAVSDYQMSDLFQDFGNENGWNWIKLSSVLPTHLATRLFLIPFDLTSQAKIIWKPSPNGIFSTKSAWDLVRKKKPVHSIFSNIWHDRIPATISIFCWKLLKNWIPVDDVLQKKGICLVSKCQCCFSTETISHVFLFNSEVSKVWEWFSNFFQVQLNPYVSISTRIKLWLTSSNCVAKGHIRTFIPLLILWFSWLARNDSKHEKKPILAAKIIEKVIGFVHLSHLAKPFSRKVWRGDLQIASSWKIGFPLFLLENF